MKRIVALLVIGFLTIGSSQVNGQSIRDLMKKKQDTEETEKTKETKEENKDGKVENAVRSGVNKSLDRLFGTNKDEPEAAEETETEYVDESRSSGNSDNDFTDKSSATGIGMNAIMSGLGITGTTNVKEVYKFDAFIEMTIINYDSDGKAGDPGKYTTYLDADSPDYGISFTDEDQDGEMLMIFDTENNLMLTLMESEGEKTGFAVAFTEDQKAAMEESYEEEELEDAEANPYNIKKTGKTKKILGYKCDEYLTEDEYSIVRMWVTDDLEKKISKTFMKSAQFGSMFTYAYFTKGFVMESEVEEKDDHEKSVMTVTDIDVNNVTSIKTGGYTIMNMGAMEGLMGGDEEEEEE